MIKTVCKDCGQDYGKLTRDGICNYCARRRANCNYLKKDYIPLIKIKGTVEYNRAMGKRASSEAKRIEEGRLIKQQVTKKKPELKPKIKEEPKKSNIEEAVEKDLTKYYTDKGILVKNDFLPLEIIYEWFFSICQKENYMIAIKLIIFAN